jgi:peptidyl-prolyl cis-trans isomerase B (cyclophilin B)
MRRWARAAGVLMGVVGAEAAGHGQQGITITPDTVYLAAERLMVDRLYPAQPDWMPPSLDTRLLATAEVHPTPAVRAAAVRAIGRFENPADVPRIAQHIGDPDPQVRREVVHALVMALQNAELPDDARAIATAFDVLRRRLVFERGVAAVESTILESLGELPLDDRQGTEVERLLFERLQAAIPDSGAVRGLEAWYRRHRDRPVSDAMRARLRELAVPHIDRGPYLAAIEALRSIGDTDERTLTTASAYTCPRPPPKCGWEIRRAAVTTMAGGFDRFSTALYRRLDDAHYLVRLEAVRAVGRSIPSTLFCAPLIAALGDESRHVVLAAIELLHPSCNDRDDALGRLRAYAAELGNASLGRRWHEPAQALLTLVKFAPDEALRIASEVAARHEAWQVRAAAARVAELTRTESVAIALIRDDEPNVRMAALSALASIGSDARVAAALEALAADDVQLVLTGAEILKKGRLDSLASPGLADAVYGESKAALVRLTARDYEPSRDARIELLARLGETGGTSDVELNFLRVYLKDTDPFVAAAAADALGALTGTRPSPEPTRRPLEQPTDDELRNLRKAVGGASAVVIWLDDGSDVPMRLSMADAPLTAARFVKLARAGYYNGLTFHRVVADVHMAGGSPKANDFSGDRRFWPAEISGVSPSDGLVGHWTGARHTASGQFFIAAVSAPASKYQYTFFGRACVAERVMTGALIREISISRVGTGSACDPRS